MEPLHAALIALAGVGAGLINTVVGSGTLITFPTLLGFGVPPVVANVSNNIGLVPGSLTGAWGYRAHLAGQRARVWRLLSASLLGGAVGALLLLVLPEGAFETVVPLLIGLGIVLVIFQPRLSAWVARRSAARAGTRPVASPAATPAEPEADDVTAGDPWWIWPAVLLTGVYGGYFGAAQGVLLMGVLGIGISQSLQASNAVKNVLAAGVNAVAGGIFAVVADVDWLVVALIGGGAVVGGLIGARVGQRLPPMALRVVIVVVGVIAVISFVV